MNTYEVIIIGGSYSGLSAALTLGRSLRKVLILDSGLPCNRSTPKSHNFLTRDGQSPGEIMEVAMNEIRGYSSVDFREDLVVTLKKTNNGFKVTTGNSETYTAKKLILATGLKDKLPDIQGIWECWGISILHCPYCHGYEITNQKTGVLGNGDTGFELAVLISNWTSDLCLFTNGRSTLSRGQSTILRENGISIVETPIREMVHKDGKLQEIIFFDEKTTPINALYTQHSIQQTDIPKQLNCQLSDTGRIVVDEFQKTSVPGVFACGDNSNLLRSVSLSVSSGSKAGMFLNHELIKEDFSYN